MLAVFPGSFDPPTVAHVAIAEAALQHVDEVRFVLSEVALGKKDAVGRTPVDVRRQVLDAITAITGGLSVVVTPASLIADIAAESAADAVIVGRDKWAQILDPAWYGGSVPARDAAVARLPLVLLVPRAGPEAAPAVPAPSGPEVVTLHIEARHHDVSSTRARAGELGLIATAARAAGHWG